MENMELTILGIKVKVNLKDAFDRDAHLYGSYDGLKSEINLCNMQDTDQLNATFLHEINHAINSTLGLGMSEELITTFSAAQFAVLKENCIKTDWIKK